MIREHQYKFLTVAAIVVVALLGLALFLYPTGNDEAGARTAVSSFGAQLQKVSLLAPDASSSIAAVYGPFVSPELLARWSADPSHAPGRQTSSPWPDHIDTQSVTPQGSGFLVFGTIVLMTSQEKEHGGNAGTTPVILQLVKDEKGIWRIVAYEERQS